jgi:hypothetical protein
MRYLLLLVMVAGFAACWEADPLGPEDAYLSAEVNGAISAGYLGDARYSTQQLHVKSYDREAGPSAIGSIRLGFLDGIVLDDGTLVSFYDLGRELTAVSGVLIQLVKGSELYAAHNARLALGEVTADMITGRFAFRAYQVCPPATGDGCSIPLVIPKDHPFVDVEGRFAAAREAPPRPLSGD